MKGERQVGARLELRARVECCEARRPANGDRARESAVSLGELASVPMEESHGCDAVGVGRQTVRRDGVVTRRRAVQIDLEIPEVWLRHGRSLPTVSPRVRGALGLAAVLAVVVVSGVFAFGLDRDGVSSAVE